MTNVYFVRHGETDLNLQHISQGQIDTHGLNDTGKAQAQALVDFIRKSGLKGDAVLSSPLKRALETAAPVAALFGVKIATDERLKEMFFGQGENIPIKSIRAMVFDPPLEYGDGAGGIIRITNGNELRDWHASTDPRYDNIAHPGGESKAEVRDRACAAVVSYIEQHKDVKNLWVVCHGALLRFVTATIAGHGALEGEVKNASVLHYAYDPKAPRKLKWHGVLHAPE